jgi:hypothetical protein
MLQNISDHDSDTDYDPMLFDKPVPDPDYTPALFLVLHQVYGSWGLPGIPFPGEVTTRLNLLFGQKDMTCQTMITSFREAVLTLNTTVGERNRERQNAQKNSNYCWKQYQRWSTTRSTVSIFFFWTSSGQWMTTLIHDHQDWHSNVFNTTCRTLTLDVLSGRASRDYACVLKHGESIQNWEP